MPLRTCTAAVRCGPVAAWLLVSLSVNLGMLGYFKYVSFFFDSARPTDVYSFMIARFIGGVGVGISTVAAPLYISEISPAARRGRSAGMFQFNIVFGILIAFASNALLSGIGENAQRWMLGIEAILALIFALLCLRLPESPRWLISRRGDETQAARVIRLANP